jgi:hypothetical protein
MTQISNSNETYQLYKKIENYIDVFSYLTKNQFNILMYCRYGKINNNVYNFILEFFFQNFLAKTINDESERYMGISYNKSKFFKVISKCNEQFEIIDKILVIKRNTVLFEEIEGNKIEDLNDEFATIIVDKKIQNEELDDLLETIEKSELESDDEKYLDDKTFDNLISGGTFIFSYDSFMKNILNQEVVKKMMDYDKTLMNPYIGYSKIDDNPSFFCESFSGDITYYINHKVINTTYVYECSCPHFEHVCSKHNGMECKHIKLLKKIISYLTLYFKNDKWLCYDDVKNIFKEIVTISNKFVY